jgi:hypothetical protein
MLDLDLFDSGGITLLIEPLKGPLGLQYICVLSLIFTRFTLALYVIEAETFAKIAEFKAAAKTGSLRTSCDI